MEKPVVPPARRTPTNATNQPHNAPDGSSSLLEAAQAFGKYFDNATNQPSPKVKVCYCYAHEDKALRDELDKHLSALRHLGRIETWYDREILPGTEWEREIDNHIEASDLILLLISAHFLGSDYCWGKEMQQAFEKHKNGTAHVIPIILRPVLWKGTPIGELSLLPTNGKPVTQWPDRDLAFEDIAQAISLVVSNLLIKLEEEARRQQQIQALRNQIQGAEFAARTRQKEIESLDTRIKAGNDAKKSLQAELARLQRQLTQLDAQNRDLLADLDRRCVAEYEAQQEYKSLLSQLSTLTNTFITSAYPPMLCPSCNKQIPIGSDSCPHCGWRYRRQPPRSPLADSFVL